MKDVMRDYPRFYSRFLFPPLRKKVAILTGAERLPKKGPYILAVNHVGSFDPPMVVASLHPYIRQLIYFVTEQYVINAVGLRRAVERLGMIPKIEQRKNECLDTARKYLNDGKVVGIFPDGMRNDGPVLGKGKTGVARLHLWTKAPVYPIGFKGPGTWSPQQALRLWFKGMDPQPEVHVGKALSFAQYFDKPITYDILRDITDSIMRAIGILAQKPYPY